MEKGNYKKFILMLSASFIVMYGVMFLNADKLGHVYLNITRLYMALLMIAPMAVLMIAFMGKMYKDKKLNRIIMATAVLAFILVLVLLRTQTPIDDVQYMKAMIPHHSSAILTSQEANINDPEVKQLAEEIIEAQVREIEQMKNILERLD